jgi:signal transduction histidine kinase
MDRSRTPLLLFVLVAVYIVLQFSWWAWLLLTKDRQMFDLQQQLAAEGVAAIDPIQRPGQDRWMVFGEGMVFLLIVVFGLVIIYRTVRHELRLARQQRDFLLAVSHELRTPIAGLKLHLKTLERPGLRDDQRTGLTDLAAVEVDRLHTLTEKVLLATRLHDVRVAVSIVAVDVAHELKRILEGARATYGRGHAIEANIPTALVVATDADAFRSVAENLVENACKYSPPGSHVWVDLTGADGGFELTVSDEGVGVAEQDRSMIFDKFVRSGNEEVRRSKGTGLGLYIVRRLVQGLGGRIEYRPRQPKGSIFAATFPPRGPR